MEPANLNSPDPSDRQLADLFAQLDAAPLPDGGFTPRVLDALPPRSPAAKSYSEPWRYDWLAGVLAAMVVVWLSPQSAAPGWSELTALFQTVQASLLNPAVWLVLGVAGGALALTSPEVELGLGE